MKVLTPQTEQKKARFNIRATPKQREAIVKAAHLKDITVSDFIIESAYDAAVQAIADDSHIVMPPKAFEAFCAALDAPPMTNLDALRKLLTQPSILDDK